MHSPGITILLLGTMKLCDVHGAQINIKSRKSQALLAILALSEGKPVSRNRLANLLWSDVDTEFGRTNLRQALSRLKKDLGQPHGAIVTGDKDALHLDFDSLTADTTEYLQAKNTNERHALEQHIKLYRGPLLDNFPAIDPEFDSWIDLERRRFQQVHLDLLHKLLALDESAQDREGTTRTAQALLHEDPASEIAHRALMQIHAAQNRRQKVINQYQSCQIALKSRHELDPSLETTQLYQQLCNPLPTPAAKQQPPKRTLASEQNQAKMAAGKSANWRDHRPRLTHALPLVVAVFAVALWFQYPESQHSTTNTAPPVVTPNSIPIPRLTEAEASIISRPISNQRHAIAVLPFENLSGESARYFSDGLSDDLVTDISRVSGLKVIASASSFNYRQDQPDLRHVGEKLGVDFLLTGSVRKEGNRVRVNTRLVRAADQVYLWSDRFDRTVDDILNVQDEVTRHIISSLAIELTESEWQNLSTRKYVSADAYDMLLRGLHPFSQFTEQGINAGREYFEKAIEIDPDYARAYANMALSYGREMVFQITRHNPVAIETGLAHAARAESLDQQLPQTQFAKAVLHLADSNHNEALVAARKALRIDPNYADGHAVLAQVHAYSGNYREGLESIDQAMELNPVVPFTYHWVKGHLLFLMQRYADALIPLEACYKSNPSFNVGLTILAATYGQLGRIDDAEWLAEEVMVINPGFSATFESNATPYLLESQRQHYLEGMRKAGLPG